ncbi:predicted GPI-anchored protein 58 [Molossus molossus]|uniref:predicted GPI-anchored protein 58 n=1 Tax=Molossus molossus TaxID=27622 RepID=UPI0017468134|nr:predicted GPI-anchored protein 58 [Molossus molossus]
MASPGLRRRRCAVPLPGSARPPSSASSCAAFSGPRPRTPPRAPTPRAASAPAHGPLPSRASTGARRPGPPGCDRALPPPPGSAAAAAAATAPWGRVASCKCPAFCKQAPALQSHPADTRRSSGGRERALTARPAPALAPVAPRALQSPGWELALRSRSERPRVPSPLPSLPAAPPHETQSPLGESSPSLWLRSVASRMNRSSQAGR